MRRVRLKMRFLKLPVYVLTALVAVASVASGEVTRVEVTSRKPVGTSGYEKIVGTAHFAVNPKDPHNRVIADIDKAPVNANGLVEFSGDVVILRPFDASKSNGVALIDVVNRGRKTIMTTFNRGAVAEPGSDTDLGDAFLTRQGYTLVFVGWEFDVARQASSMRLDVPTAQGATGVVHGDFTPNDSSAEQTVTDLAGYVPAQPDAADTTLIVRDGPFGRPGIITAGSLLAEGQYRDVDRWLHAWSNLRIVVSSREISGLGPGDGSLPRRVCVGEALARLAGAGPQDDCVWIVAERPIPRERFCTTASTTTKKVSRCSTASWRTSPAARG